LGRWLKDQSCATDVCVIPATPAPTVPIVGDPCNITLVELVLKITDTECAGGDTSRSSALVSAVDRRAPECDPLEVIMQCEYMIWFNAAPGQDAFTEIEFFPIANIEWNDDDYGTATTEPFNITESLDIATVSIRYKNGQVVGDTAVYRCGISNDEYALGSYGVSPTFPANLCL
jgi:hypothetical protein